MPKRKNITMPGIKRLNLYGICRLAKVFAGLFESKNFGEFEGMAIAVSLSMSARSSANLTLNEIGKLIKAFNKCHAENEAIKRHLILIALLFADNIAQVEIRGQKRYSKTKVMSPLAAVSRTKKATESEIEIRGNLREGYFAVDKVVGKERTGFCRCCINYEVNKIKEKKLIEIKAVKKIHVKKAPDKPRYLFIIPTQDIHK